MNLPLPAVNALLNATSAILLVTGFCLIRFKKVRLHQTCMSLALMSSTLFLISYVTYHLHAGHVRYVGPFRVLYLLILLTHTVLAVLIVPMVLRTLYLALRKRFIEHRTLARWTLPLWLYVSVTGVVIYEMLY